MGTAAELFERGRLSETLEAYSKEDGGHGSPQKAVYNACNRAAAKLGLEMFRACIRDLDEAIKIDPFCLRAYILKGEKRARYRALWCSRSSAYL